MPDTQCPAAEAHQERLLQARQERFLQAHPAARTEVVRQVAQAQNPVVAEDIP